MSRVKCFLFFFRDYTIIIGVSIPFGDNSLPLNMIAVILSALSHLEKMVHTMFHTHDDGLAIARTSHDPVRVISAFYPAKGD